MYYKLINGQLTEANRRFIRFDGRVYTNPTPEQYAAAGFKKLVMDDMPNNGSLYTAVYAEHDDCIRGKWVPAEKEEAI